MNYELMKIDLAALIFRKMKTRFIHLAFAAAGICTAAAASQGELAKSIGQTRVETIRTRDQLQSTVNALTALTEQKKGDLRSTYQMFTAEVTNTQAAAASTASRASKMVESSKSYFDAWQSDVAAIANESLRKKAQKRLDAVRATYSDVATSLHDAAEKFKPFLSNLGDVQKTLANDVTPGGVKAVRGTVSDANWNLKKVRSSIFDALKGLESMEKSLSSETGK